MLSWLEEPNNGVLCSSYYISKFQNDECFNNNYVDMIKTKAHTCGTVFVGLISIGSKFCVGIKGL